ncbi:hypothetical protein [Capnocytophaga canis]|uniref:Uncharacterized protein n=1 Tax=Capnocytophaga canis TaxID=1848903 RepID=A0A0B7IK57_9FLAO|nr:hypothetical protein CCAND38_760006 [Capnocytophaga canis]CEN50964.1 hypothetical protein CCAND93_1290006 [Capnocytophaga canis]
MKKKQPVDSHQASDTNKSYSQTSFNKNTLLLEHSNKSYQNYRSKKHPVPNQMVGIQTNKFS